MLAGHVFTLFTLFTPPTPEYPALLLGRLPRAIKANETSPGASEAHMWATLARLRGDPPGCLRDRLLRAYERWAVE
jgi:hypothetical protein